MLDKSRIEGFGGLFDENGRLYTNEGNGITVQSFGSSKRIFAWIPKPLSVFDYSIMDYRKTGRYAWMKFVTKETNDFDGSKHFSL